MQKLSASKFSSTMSLRGERPPEQLDRHTAKILRLNADGAQVLTFDQWTPDPWTVVGENGKDLATFSGFVLTVIKALTLDGKPTQSYLMTMNVKSDGWTVSAPQTVPIDLQALRLDFRNAAGGTLDVFGPGYVGNFVSLDCGTDGPALMSGTFAVDVFSLISSAQLSIGKQWFWPC